MAIRQAGRRVATVASMRKKGILKKCARPGGRRDEPLRPAERRLFIQALACGAVFVIIVAVKLLLPSQIGSLSDVLSRAMERNIDVAAVFSAVGEAVTGDKDASNAAKEVYQAVFGAEEGEAVEAAATVEEPAPITLPESDSAAMVTLQQHLSQPSSQEEVTQEQLPQDVQQSSSAEENGQSVSQQVTDVESIALVQYSENNLPDHVSLEQAILGFDYTTPVVGTLTSPFGYREHPVEGEERFHYGLDIAADTGTAIGAFADGTVVAVGDSSSYGKYCIVSHTGGYESLYAHCSKITVSSGEKVSQGQKLAEVGETGIATGPHLHFELHKGDLYLNPIYYVETV